MPFTQIHSTLLVPVFAIAIQMLCLMFVAHSLTELEICLHSAFLPHKKLSRHSSPVPQALCVECAHIIILCCSYVMKFFLAAVFELLSTTFRPVSRPFNFPFHVALTLFAPHPVKAPQVHTSQCRNTLLFPNELGLFVCVLTCTEFSTSMHCFNPLILF